MEEAILNQLLKDQAETENELKEIRTKLADLQLRMCVIEEGGMVQE